MNEQTFNVLQHPADVGGCSHYRLRFPEWALQTIRRDVRFISSMKLIVDPQFFRDLRVVRLQRQVSNSQCEYFLKFLAPLSNSIGFWLIYEIDDVIGYEDIPAYNHSRKAFETKTFFDNVKNMLGAADLITVTTDALKEYYHTKYDVPNHKIVVIPNYLPRWWIGETYSIDRQMQQLNEYSRKPRIGLPLSSSHYDLTGINNYVDDLTHIVDFIRGTVDKYQWVFVGHVPKQLHDLAKSGKIEVGPGSDLLNYPRELWRKNLQCIIAPLQDNIFNRCKSSIKFAEASALGIPAIVQDLEPYSKYTDMTFTDANSLQNKLDYLFRDHKKYRKIIKENRHIVDYGDKFAPNGWWLEKNLKRWNDIFTLPQKTIRFDLSKMQSAGSCDEGIKLDLT